MMELHINNNLIYNSELLFTEQNAETQDYINAIAFSYNGANQDISVWKGDDTPGLPKRYDWLVHDISTQEGLVIRTTVECRYQHPYGTPAAFAGTHYLNLEVING
ncbi:hypothetical protein [uncultured Pontibacter sp.]|uniref:hypothetical protein n=1 Tax=uncultured Pontibacter sp. TaxID=453356 RepID=UPI0026043FDA|nr:hypothetical protein [uncultured Pontibacter sp.]